MNCSAVRDVLPEFALGVAPGGDVSAIELHVEQCAACRKETLELQRAVTAFGYALPPVDAADPGLELRVVDAVRGAARRASPTRDRPTRSRRAGVTLIAAALLVATLGVGAVMANRAERLRLQAERIALQNQQELESFGDAVASARFADPGAEVFTGLLAASDDASGTGSGLTIVSPASQDQVIVIVHDLSRRSAPLALSIANARGRTLELGAIRRLDSAGGATAARALDVSLAGFIDVIVRDARGRVVLRGTLAAETAVASASP